MQIVLDLSADLDRNYKMFSIAKAFQLAHVAAMIATIKVEPFIHIFKIFN
jgi:hypothetical protein